MQEQPIKSVLIVGTTLEGWLSAAFLTRQFKDTGLQVQICAHKQQAGPSSKILETTPSLAHLHGLLNLDERDIIKFCQGVFRLGSHFENWHKSSNAHYIHAYHEQADGINGVAFHHHWLRLKQAGNSHAFDEYSLGARMGHDLKFRHPIDDDKQLRAKFAYGYHLDQNLYTDFMRKCALHYGTHDLNNSIDTTTTDTNGITSLTCTNGKVLAADLYLDCTGTGDVLSAVSGDENWQDWSQDTPFNTIARVNVQEASTSPLAHIQTFSHGWVQSIALQSGGEKTCVFTQGAADILPEQLGTEDIQTETLKLGKQNNPWVKNCIAIGRSACRLSPLEAPQMRLNEVALNTLRGLFPASRQSTGECAEYNRILGENFDRFRDFQIAHYKLAAPHKLAAPQDEAWGLCTKLPVSDALARKIEQFESRGRVVMYDHESFNAESWIALFLGQGLIPKRYDPLAENVPFNTLEHNVGKLHTSIAQATSAAPNHLDYIERAGALTPMKAT